MTTEILTTDQAEADAVAARQHYEAVTAGIENGDTSLGSADLAEAKAAAEHAEHAVVGARKGATARALKAHAAKVDAWQSDTRHALVGSHDSITGALLRLEAALDEALAAIGDRNKTVTDAHDSLNELAAAGELPASVGTGITRGDTIQLRVHVEPGVTVGRTDAEAVVAATVVRAFDRAGHPLERLGRLASVAEITSDAPDGAMGQFR